MGKRDPGRRKRMTVPAQRLPSKRARKEGARLVKVSFVFEVNLADIKPAPSFISTGTYAPYVTEGEEG